LKVSETSTGDTTAGAVVKDVAIQATFGNSLCCLQGLSYKALAVTDI
jgi:hypothetical protein